MPTTVGNPTSTSHPHKGLGLPDTHQRFTGRSSTLLADTGQDVASVRVAESVFGTVPDIPCFDWHCCQWPPTTLIDLRRGFWAQKRDELP